MAPRGEVVLQVTFGPSKSPVASRAVSYARAHAEEAAEIAPGVWRASFRLGADERAFGMAFQLLQMVLGWRSTTVEVDGSPEPPWVTRTELDPQAGVVTVIDGAVQIQPQEPLVGARQRFVYKEPGEEGTWQLWIVEFCSRMPECPHDVGEWMRDQLGLAAGRAVLPAMLVFIGGWLIGLGTRAWSRPTGP